MIIKDAMQASTGARELKLKGLWIFAGGRVRCVFDRGWVYFNHFLSQIVCKISRNFVNPSQAIKIFARCARSGPQVLVFLQYHRKRICSNVHLRQVLYQF